MSCSTASIPATRLISTATQASLLVAAHEVDGADVGGPFPAHQPQALPAPAGRRGQQLLEVGLDAVLGQRDVGVGRAHLVADVGEHLGEFDLEPFLLAPACLRTTIRPGSSSITVGGVIQFSGLTLWLPWSEKTMNVPSALIISSRVASARWVLSRPE